MTHSEAPWDRWAREEEGAVVCIRPSMILCLGETEEVEAMIHRLLLGRDMIPLARDLDNRLVEEEVQEVPGVQEDLAVTLFRLILCHCVSISLMAEFLNS